MFYKYFLLDNIETPLITERGSDLYVCQLDWLIVFVRNNFLCKHRTHSQPQQPWRTGQQWWGRCVQVPDWGGYLGGVTSIRGWEIIKQAVIQTCKPGSSECWHSRLEVWDTLTSSVIKWLIVEAWHGDCVSWLLDLNCPYWPGYSDLVAPMFSGYPGYRPMLAGYAEPEKLTGSAKRIWWSELSWEKAGV